MIFDCIARFQESLGFNDFPVICGMDLEQRIASTDNLTIGNRNFETGGHIDPVGTCQSSGAEDDRAEPEALDILEAEIPIPFGFERSTNSSLRHGLSEIAALSTDDVLEFCIRLAAFKCRTRECATIFVRRCSASEEQHVGREFKAQQFCMIRMVRALAAKDAQALAHFECIADKSSEGLIHFR